MKPEEIIRDAIHKAKIVGGVHGPEPDYRHIVASRAALRALEEAGYVIGRRPVGDWIRLRVVNGDLEMHPDGDLVTYAGALDRVLDAAGRDEGAEGNP